MTEEIQNVFYFDVVEGSHVYNSASEYYRVWSEIPRVEQEQFVRLRDELQELFMKVKG
jgi:hypothetical protein